jgi:hypothetical protein
VGLEGLSQRKIPMMESGIELATFRLVAQSINELQTTFMLIPWKTTEICRYSASAK